MADSTLSGDVGDNIWGLSAGGVRIISSKSSSSSGCRANVLRPNILRRRVVLPFARDESRGGVSHRELRRRHVKRIDRDELRAQLRKGKVVAVVREDLSKNSKAGRERGSIWRSQWRLRVYRAYEGSVSTADFHGDREVMRLTRMTPSAQMSAARLE